MADDFDFNTVPNPREDGPGPAPIDTESDHGNSEHGERDEHGDNHFRRHAHSSNPTDDEDDEDNDIERFGLYAAPDELFDLMASETDGEAMSLTDASSSDEEDEDEDEWLNNGLNKARRQIKTKEEVDELIKSLNLPQIPVPATFPKFMQLPAELRFKIWEIFCPDLKTPRCVLQVSLNDDGRLVAMPMMRPQMRRMRRLLSVHRESRALALKRVPDELNVGSSQYDKNTIARFDAKRDIVHIVEERGSFHTHPLSDLYAHVRHLAIKDWEPRSRPPGVYLDRVFGHNVFEMMSADEASHQTPNELRTEPTTKWYAGMFPNLERLYVAEPGSVRRLDRWVGDNNHHEYHVRTYEWTSMGRKLPVNFTYCWQEPEEEKDMTKKEKKRKEEEQEGKTVREKVESTEGETRKGPDKSNGNDDDDNNNSSNKDDGSKPGDEAVINQMSILKNRDVQHVRFLCFELDEGREAYRDLKQMCGPDGSWPNDSDGRPVQDERPMHEDDIGFDMLARDNEYESEGIDDDEIEEPHTSDEEEDEEDDLLVQPLTDEEDEDEYDGHGHDRRHRRRPEAVANFSSPEPDPESEPEQPRPRGKRRRIVSDSEDDEEEESGAPAGEDSATDAPAAKRRRRTMIIDDDDDDEEEEDNRETEKRQKEESEEEEEEEEDVAGPSNRRRGAARVADDSDDTDSSHTEEGDTGRPLTLAERLQLNRLKNPIPSDDEDEEEEDDDEEEEEMRHRGGLMDLYADDEDSEDEGDFAEEDDDEEDDDEAEEEDEFDDGESDE